ncbi:hypothetical protein SAMD00019534_123470 [Acytostelium subglobosum LB1]|uniref:hypothetical protein n=1 Tax=Acytostelium subglobosum LB1 TaxID=1410327 RepID=UPI000644F129|nr:hypothetical protein SAMD00019534_123470 [Acytostelium subglobosum LB1]GAM29171.1 hypothetical protein SAMD00019534_123470 [Acytostelium subglobosum LB1]|eukprot:XP_012747862.1 hypothetical protein SAMD00019534_123470 [Acytostelium subglobosum LB1]
MLLLLLCLLATTTTPVSAGLPPPQCLCLRMFTVNRLDYIETDSCDTSKQYNCTAPHNQCDPNYAFTSNDGYNKLYVGDCPNLPYDEDEDVHILGSVCCQCAKGYIMNNQADCVLPVVDPCQTANCAGTCQNSGGTAVCSCAPPLILGTDYKSCFQNVCSTANGGCQQSCESIDGKAKCTCAQYYSLAANNKSCIHDPINITAITHPDIYFNEAGNITIIGAGFNVLPNSNVSASIGDALCKRVKVINSTHIVCQFAGDATPSVDSNSLSVNVTIDGAKASNQLFFYTQYVQCLNGCSGHGTCNNKTGECTCEPDYGRTDCSFNKQTNNLPPPTIDESGGTLFPISEGKGSNFTLSIMFLRELDNLDRQVKLLKMSEIIWTARNVTPDSNTYHYRGVFPNDTATFEVQIDYFKDATKVDFAGETIQILDNSIKYTISIQNWRFNSTLNTLHIVYSTKSSNPCADMTVDKNVGISNSSSPYPFLDVADGTGAVMQGRFASRMLIDERIVKSLFVHLPTTDNLYQLLPNDSLSTTFNVLTANVLPAFSRRAKVDPNFGVMVAINGVRDQCSESDNKIGWKIPVIVVCSVVGAALVAVSIAFIARSKFVMLKMSQIRMKNIE